MGGIAENVRADVTSFITHLQLVGGVGKPARTRGVHDGCVVVLEMRWRFR